MTSGLRDVASRRWDAVVIGAGPAGSMTAYELARRGRSVLLVERSAFPRWKVCGACLGELGLAVLEHAGLGQLPLGRGGRLLNRTSLMWRGRERRLPMPRMVVLSRGSLDAGLRAAAQDAGATCLDQVSARIEAVGVGVRLEAAGETVCVRPACTVMAGGLRQPDSPATSVQAGSWIGLGVQTPAATSGPDDELLMIAARHGYLGAVRTESRSVNWAAAVDPAFVRACGGPAGAMSRLCREAGSGVVPPTDGWKGTPMLTRRVPAQFGHVFRVGDAAGYVEPITGEGMSWALLGGFKLAAYLDQFWLAGRPGPGWESVHHRALRWRRARCAAVAAGLRSGSAMRLAFGLLSSPDAARRAMVRLTIGGAA